MKYSNCLIEAVKVKIKDPKNIRIIVIRPGKISKSFHIAWTDGDFFYHAYSQRQKWWNRYIYKPSFKKVPFTVFESFVCDKLKGEPIKKQKKVMKQLRVHLVDIPYTDCERWCWVCDENDLPKENDVKYMEKVFRGKVFIKVVQESVGMQVLSYEDVLKLRIGTNISETWGWRYITPMDTPDFCGLYGYHIRVKLKELSDEKLDPPISQRRRKKNG